MKTIVHYKNGQQHTVNYLFISYTEWVGSDVSVCGELWPNTDISDGETEILFKDVLFLEEISKEDGAVKLHFDPDTDMSVKVGVMTAKQRAKTNRSNILSVVGQTRKQLKESLSGYLMGGDYE
jgi:hypothetical protein